MLVKSVVAFVVVVLLVPLTTASDWSGVATDEVVLQAPSAYNDTRQDASRASTEQPQGHNGAPFVSVSRPENATGDALEVHGADIDAGAGDLAWVSKVTNDRLRMVQSMFGPGGGKMDFSEQVDDVLDPVMEDPRVVEPRPTPPPVIVDAVEESEAEREDRPEDRLEGGQPTETPAVPSYRTTPFAPVPASSGEAEFVERRDGPLVWTQVAAVVATTAGIWVILRCLPAVGAFFTRINQQRAARQPARRLVLDLLARSPGLTADEIQDAAGYAEGTIRYHLRVLERHGLVHSAASGRRRHFFTNCREYANQDERQQAAALSCEVNRAILSAVGQNPGVHQGRISELVGLSRSRSCERVARLVDLGLLEAERRGRRIAYHLADPYRERSENHHMPAAVAVI